MSANAHLLWMLAEYLLLTGLPGVFAACVAMRRGLRQLPLLLAVALAASGAVAMLVFWAFYAAPEIGKTAAFFVAFGSALGIGWCYREGLDRELLRRLAFPLALWVLSSVFVVYLGFLHGGSGEAALTAQTRYAHQLPYDNVIPEHFADWFYVHGHDGTPTPIGDWLASDRPPLQIGYVLAERPFGWGEPELNYEVLAVVVQELWVIGLWALLVAARIGRLARALGLIAAAVSDVAILHGFFVWPKLIAAAMLLAALAIVLDQRWDAFRRDPRAAALFAALCSLAMLAHGSSAFFIIPMLGLAALRGLPSVRWLGVAALVAVVLFVPWTAYQRWGDPPGDRLIKWQLGGSLEIDDRSSLETIVDGYSEEGLGGSLSNKWSNFTRMADFGEIENGLREAGEAIEAGHLGSAVSALRLPRFYGVVPFLGLLLIGPIAMAVARAIRPRDGPEWRFAVVSIGFVLAACVVWGLLMFGNIISNTTLHVGSLAVPLLAASACVVGAHAVDRRLAIGLTAVNAAFVLVLYVPALNPPPGSSYSALAAVLAAASLAGFVFTALRAP